MGLIELTNKIESLKAQLSEKAKQWELDSKTLKSQIADIETKRRVVSDGLDLSQIEIAEACMYFRGNPGEVRHGFHNDQSRTAVRPQAIADAIKAIAESDDPLSKQYIGVKNYDGFGDQREDHSYGMGPRHGSIVFEIGRKNPACGKMIDEERNACIYYLMNWQKIYQAKTKAA